MYQLTKDINLRHCKHTVTFEFQCSSSSGFNLCFNNGVCIVDNSSNSSSCICPTGFGPDNVFGRFANCVLPNSLTLWFLVVHSILTVISVATMVVNMRRAKALVLKTGLWFIAFILALWGHVLAVYLEDGNRIGGCIMVGFAALALISVAETLITLFLEPLYALSRLSYEFVRNGMGMFMMIARVLFVAEFTAAAVMGAIDDTGFNITMSVVMTSVATGVIIFSANIFYLTVQLEKKLSIVANQMEGNTLSRDAAQAAKYRIRLLQQLVVFIGFTDGVCLLPLPIVFWIIGSVPYAFVLWMIIMSAPLVMMPTSVKFLKGKVKSNFETIETTALNIERLASSQVPF